MSFADQSATTYIATTMEIRVETAQNVFIDYEVASIGDRILGYLIDAVIFIAYLILGLLLVDTLFEGEVKTVMAFVVGMPAILYDLIFEIAMDGQSPGKRVMDMKVVDLSGRQPSVGAYVLRWMTRPIDFTIMSGAVALISVVASGKGQRVGDLLANTSVVKTSRKVGFSNELMPEFEEEYEAVYPQVAQLTDRDVNIIKEVLRRYRRSRDSSSLQLMSQKAKEVLDVETAEPHFKFLKQVVKDYHHISSLD